MNHLLPKRTVVETNIRASQNLHKTDPRYGQKSQWEKEGSLKSLLTIPKAVRSAASITKIESILDYGTGKGGLINLLSEQLDQPMTLTGFDPAVEKFSSKPKQPHDILICVDVLEHIEKRKISSTLNQISNLTRKFFFFCIDLVPAEKKLNDFRNAHIMLAPADWWCQQIKNEFLIASFIELGHLYDGSRFPVRLAGCATNSMRYFNAMNSFIANIKILKNKLIWTESGSFDIEMFDDSDDP